VSSRLHPLWLWLLAGPALAGEPAEPPTASTEAARVICEVPASYSLSAPEDYPRHEPRVRACLRDLLVSPASDGKARETYVVRWLTGVPYLTVRVRLDGAMKQAMKKSRDPALQSWYLYGLAATTLADRDADAVQVELGGLRGAMARYQAMRALGGKRNKVVEGWLELSDPELRAVAAESVASTPVD